MPDNSTTPWHSHHMEDCRERWEGRPPNGLVIVAFIQDMITIWLRRHKWIEE